ncbi:hypothetical protein LTR37_005680 [Vermiconidia calcicola]|uniref:Uncharacterized protein n=1 Tax=Vermiconidia calcicola TaxID=1690605 RepID=A0ACC3NIS0_9PEZI|nr:hypothetical protein LTR37_005680 [Vermiconidia calcicola]
METFAIAEREPLSTYVNGRAALIGDAAHPTLPTLARGGSTFLEDAAALGVLFRGVRDADTSTISARLELFNILRLPRDATQQVLSAVMFKPQPASALGERIRPFYSGALPDAMLGGWNRMTCDFLCQYDVFRESEKAKRWADERKWQWISKLPDGPVQHFGQVLQ